MECSDLERNVFISLFSISLAVNVGLGIWFLCKKMKRSEEFTVPLSYARLTSMQNYARKNARQVVTGLQTSCYKSVHKL